MSRVGARGRRGAVALGCKMVGGGSNDTLDVCARVCVVDKQEAILYESFVKPLIPGTHYWYETTGIRPEHLRDALIRLQHLFDVIFAATRRVQDILLNGEQSYSYSSRGAARLLVGHGLEHDLYALGVDYPAHLKLDTATYPPLMKTMAAMRLYKKLRAMSHLHLHCPPKDDNDESMVKTFPARRQRDSSACRRRSSSRCPSPTTNVGASTTPGDADGSRSLRNRIAIANERAYWAERTARRCAERADRRRRKALALSQCDIVEAGGKLIFTLDDERCDDIWIDTSDNTTEDDDDDVDDSE
ncbi:hypothetical protein VPH35_057894 [Triticum aestivum]